MIRALLGGSFDPVHAGHLAMADHVLAKGLADVVHVVPAWLSPHKDHAAASPTDRLAMVRLAFAATENLVIDPREVAQNRPCFTIDTLQALRAEFPADTWLLLIGGDNVPDFGRWQAPDRLQELATVVVLGRGGQDLSAAALRAAGLRPGRTVTVPEFAHPVSSTAVRAMLAVGPADPARLQAGGLTAPVVRYILAHGLYLPDRNGVYRVPDPD